jgi:putative oligomerization/nucleic acid binding protein
MMSVTALYNVAMSPAEAFDYTREALQASGVLISSQTPPAHIEFSLTRKDVETGSIDAVMPGRALVAATDKGQATVTLVIDPAAQFILYAVALGLAALLFGGFIFGNFTGLWFLIVLAAEGYLFWAIFYKWPTDALNLIRSKMQASAAVTGGATVAQPVAPIFASPQTGDIADQIRKLAELRDQGHLTQDEFDAKKAELLKRM